MAYRLKTGRPMEKELGRVLDEQLARALQAVARRGMPLAERIHVARTSCKRIRAALLLLRAIEPRSWHRANVWFRDSARDFAAGRDAAIMPATFTTLLQHAGDSADRNEFGPLRHQILAHRREILGDAPCIARMLARFAERMREGRKWRTKLAKRTVEPAMITAAFGEAYRAARTAWRHAQARRSTAAFHDYRKCVKHHGYHCRLFRCAWPKVMREWQSELNRLGDLLGEEHDLAVLKHLLAARAADPCAGHAALRLRKLIHSRRIELQQRSLLLGARLFADKPHAVSRRIAAWWRTANAWADGNGETAIDS